MCIYSMCTGKARKVDYIKSLEINGSEDRLNVIVCFTREQSSNSLYFVRRRIDLTDGIINY